MTPMRTAYGPNLLSRLLAARTPHEIDDCAKAAWALNGEGLIDDQEIAYLSPVIEHQRKAIRSSLKRIALKQPCLGLGRPACRRRSSIPVCRKAEAWLRRRAQAKDCILPTSIAKSFTTGKLAVLAVIARSVIERGCSTMSLSEIAARAGVGCTTARYAIREARQAGLLDVTENRRNHTWSRPNTIRIVCPRWLKWISGHKAIRERRRCHHQPVSKGVVAPLRNLRPTIEISKFTLEGSLRLQGAWLGEKPLSALDAKAAPIAAISSPHREREPIPNNFGCIVSRAPVHWERCADRHI